MDKKSVHVSTGGPVPKGKSGSGRTLDHASVGNPVVPQTAPNNPNTPASGKPMKYEEGIGTFHRSAKNKNYAANPKKG